jgi:asparagine synthase (glutamine-hydrolysing)
MCGFFGVVGRKLDDLDAERCLTLIHHRGPDSARIARFRVGDRDMLFGVTRLAILDLSPAGHQPMVSRNRTWWVAYNGEIYNHVELRHNIAIPFRGHSDTETLVECLAACGCEATLGWLNGMFAFAALNLRERKLFLARDPFGIKPVYYTNLPNGGFAFASEVRVLKAIIGITPPLDRDAVQCFLTLRFVPSPRTMWQGINRLPAGHMAVYDFDRSCAHVARYIQPVAGHFIGTPRDAAVAYREVLRRSVERQLLSDVPIGIMLSGGVDSAVVAAIVKETGQRLPCYTVGFRDSDPESEILGAAATARALALPFFPVRVTPEDLITTFDAVTAAVEEPIVSTSALALWHLVARMRQDVTVALSGQGSDEPWGGYTRYQNELVRRLIPLPALTFRLLPFGEFVKRLPEAAARACRSLPIGHAARRFEEAYALFTAAERAALTGNADDGGALNGIQYWLDWCEKSREPVEQMMQVDSRTCLPDDWLLYTDKISMAFSLETRVPLLDLDVVRFVETLPRRYKLALGKRKIVHKMMAGHYLPAEIVHRRKLGFPVPFVSWSRGPLRDQVAEQLLERLPRGGRFDRATIERLWRHHIEGTRDVARQIYALFALANWLKAQEA